MTATDTPKDTEGGMSMLIGYARVSTKEQDPTLQIRALRKAGVKTVHHEYKSGAAERPILEDLLLNLKAGDVLMVYKVDRLARSLADLLRIISAVAAAGASFKSLTEPIETTTPAGRMMVQLLGAFAEFERAIIKERCNAGRVVAQENGTRFGRPASLTESQISTCHQLSNEGLSAKDIAKKYGVHADTVRRALGRRHKGLPVPVKKDRSVPVRRRTNANAPARGAAEMVGIQ